MPEQFWLLQKGDIIRRVNSKTYRMILECSKNRKGRMYYATLQRVGYSWTGQPTISISSNESANFLPVKVKNKRIYSLTFSVIMAKRKKVYEKAMQQKLIEAQNKLQVFKMNHGY